ncbi:four-carbon acid sugar kinase family protein [Canibacter zhuwentaonis]|uniref:four-carbon acid sugar kinase family protein n=1 Tax=Canibacter zhuwentaonis TaxID=2837491 RepID=UPI002028E70B|nr:four-carbon acid sugar kinase family protein [Canibacter zhuwentaonis]
MGYKLQEILANSSEACNISADAVLRANRAHAAPVLVVLDDDPTGTQSIANLPVLTSWSVADFEWAFQLGAPAVYVLTNSRSLAPAEAAQINREVVRAAYSAAGSTKISFVSRGDSTLRGHFPLEPETLAGAVREHTGTEIDATVIVPAFPDAGRITVNSVHYAANKAGEFVPVGETDYAQDATFGYENSDLAAWVAEKTRGKVAAADVIRIQLNELRHAGGAAVLELLRGAQRGAVIVADCVTESDLRSLALALNTAEKEGKNFIYRVGPPFVRARLGMDSPPPCDAAQLRAIFDAQSQALPHGLIVVGSHVELTSRQLAHLQNSCDLARFELDVRRALGVGRDEYLVQLATSVSDALRHGEAVIATSRELVRGTDGQSSLEIARRVSAAMVEVVNKIVHRNPPKFVIAKGGITSSDTASLGLEIRRAQVIGPMLPGLVSLWVSASGVAANVPYIVFAGNVGDESSLSEVVAKLQDAAGGAVADAAGTASAAAVATAATAIGTVASATNPAGAAYPVADSTGSAS